VRCCAETRAGRSAVAGASLEQSPFFPERLAQTVDPSLDTLDIRIELPFSTVEPPALLRLFRGTVRPGELEDYVSEVRTGTLADADAGRGPAALYLATDPPDGFITVSLWSSWEAIALATGGNIQRPTITKDSPRLCGINAV